MTLESFAAEWWRGCSLRERVLLTVLASMAFALIAWYGIASPLRQAARQSEQHRARAAQVLSEVEAARAAIGTIVPATDASAGDVLMLSAAEAGFELESHREDGASEIAVSGHAADPGALFGWIEMLRKNHGIVVSNLTVEREESGALRVEAVLARGSS